MKIIKAVIEYNPYGCLLQAENYPGAFSRSKSIDDAIKKIKDDVIKYIIWSNCEALENDYTIEPKKLIESVLNVHDADSDVIFDSEKEPLSYEEYIPLKNLAIKSASDFQALYNSISDKALLLRQPRKTFYGAIPNTANEMYSHTNNVTSYYMKEIGVDAMNMPDIISSRIEAFSVLEKTAVFPADKVFRGSYDEYWSLKKVLRRFILHDRIHGKAMFRAAKELSLSPSNPFNF
ncbi:MAG: hypothetical protein RRY79_07930 [Clostridia bacterium]